MKTVLLLAFSIVAGAAQAQEPAAPAPSQGATAQVDGRFVNWLGCWRLEDDLPGTGARVCITPDDPGVRLQTIVAGRRTADESLRGDGVQRPITDNDCKGTERAEWSKDRLRLFRYTDVTCGSEPARKVSSVAFLSYGPAWINIQMVEGGAPKSVRVQRYRRAVDQTLPDGSRVPQTPIGGASRIPTEAEIAWNVDDVIEASGKMPAEVVQAALTEARGRFDLNKKNLIAMADGGVTEATIDLVIGLAYPRKFVVERQGGSSLPIGISTGAGLYDPFFSPIYWGSAYADCYQSFGGYYGYRSYYNSMGCGGFYPYYGFYPYGYNYGYYNNGGWIIVDPNPTPTPPVIQTEGRAVNGRGYTQVRPRDPEPTASRGGNNGSNGSAAGWSGNSGATSGGASSSGYSSGSSGGGSSGGDSGARTAVSRPPGGN